MTVQTPDGAVHENIRESIPTIALHVDGHQTNTTTVHARFGDVAYIDGGVAGPTPALGTYVMTYVFEFASGARSAPVQFTLTLR